MKLKGIIKAFKGGLLVIETAFSLPIELAKEYEIDIKPYKSSRSLGQNNLMWEFISQIAEYSNEDAWSVYVQGLEKCSAKFDYIACLPDAENTLAKQFRAYKPMGKVFTEKGKELQAYKVWFGSSKMNTKEMTDLINYFEGWLEAIKEKEKADIGY